ncbi:bifunctional ornithine acetyltransferase/N-acetylglutamate synthase [Pseudoneobacillus rhizosphaerae]|jgi:glutamate N-acetyltransferase / amino-acid N-acetyltransferase|uniref:Arginine biosynthesis bifunctional protein ArgJ n=1 Tax=Pseudoneobacillus rhizosphaerae TaxID=2880968 RepID=A0A9C7LAB7_9BACI|nr:bifunctional ornithine acetyltransferase/N-acetylglutamate synthase [Pseudoneobacillus rhizosphaerae]CAG9607290.1 Arginine biosynthesis bifunctional protein ArgJ [Pseudoneobacillus rhizosphaerae]
MQVMTNGNITIVKDGNVTTPIGFTAGGVHCGIKRKRLDLGYVYSDVPATTAGVYTTNLFQAAPLVVTQKSIEIDQKIQAILVNSGNANACTGDQGLQDAYTMQTEFAKILGIKDHYVAVTSTGVIGVPLPMEKIKEGIQQILQEEHSGADLFQKAILTTDTGIKNIAVQLEIDGKIISIGGAAKGSGMIHPNMATMLGFITTDAKIDYSELWDALKQITNQTFNMISVDGDSSTNDMVLVMANGKAENKTLTKEHPSWSLFIEGLKVVSESLAKQIARDGEGATKLIEVNVAGAENVEGARAIGKAIISSNLVKTAIYGTDPNWGRIVCAVGYSGVLIDPNRVSVTIGPYQVVEKGLPSQMDEAEVKKYLEQENIHIYVDLNQGEAAATAWGCDLSYDYVKINASYRT